MLSLIQSIVQGFEAGAQLVINIVSSLLSFIVHIPTYSAFVINSINILPNIVLPFALASISISIVLFLINRKQG